eukprot:scaffold183_cov249-Pinguiococcus_pyrenoidosus.AAC.1
MIALCGCGCGRGAWCFGERRRSRSQRFTELKCHGEPRERLLGLTRCDAAQARAVPCHCSCNGDIGQRIPAERHGMLLAVKRGHSSSVTWGILED